VQDADGMGVVSIGSKDGAAVEEARRRIELILDPPSAEVGAIYEGRVVNITKFGAFVNILPGRDGLIHISKLGQGKRIDRVEDVLSLGDELSVRVDDIDQNGKLSLSLVGDDSDGGGDAPAPSDRGERPERAERSERPERSREEREPRSEHRSESRGSGNGGGRETASFEAFWDGEAREQFGELGPAEEPAGAGGGRGGGDRGGARRGGRGGGGGGGGRRGGGPRR
jgi:polyribonucleotide nucleotidyltransferase